MVAVSGGVDSVVLLNALSKLSNIRIIIAHFDHGIRLDSREDREFVEQLAVSYGFPFECAEGNLGANASEALARKKRYEFLNKVKETHKADAIMTAHHKDDVLETACINILRGTGRKGLSSLTNGVVVRPLLPYTKAQIIEYATKNGLEWREDSTNAEDRYLRNRIRKLLLASDKELKAKLEGLIKENSVRNQEIDDLLEQVFVFGYAQTSKTFSQLFFIHLPHNVSCEVLAFWLRKYSIEFDRSNIELLAAGLKTGRNGIKLDAGQGWYFLLRDKQISLEARSSV